MFVMRNGFSRTQSQNIFAKLSSDHSFFGKSNSKSKSDVLDYPPSFTIKHGCELCLGFSVPTNFLKVIMVVLLGGLCCQGCFSEMPRQWQCYLDSELCWYLACYNCYKFGEVTYIGLLASEWLIWAVDLNSAVTENRGDFRWLRYVD